MITNKYKYEQELEKRTSQLRRDVLPILCALLSSGHYTDKTDDNDPFVLEADHGKKWEEDGFSRRFENRAITDAIDLADELHRRMEDEVKMVAEMIAEEQEGEPFPPPVA